MRICKTQYHCGSFVLDCKFCKEIEWDGRYTKWYKLCSFLSTVFFKINTTGGGFASIRSPIERLPAEMTGLRIKFRGDGRTYKVLLSDGKSSGPRGGSPSWQVDLPTKKLDAMEKSQVADLPLSSFLPSFGGRPSLSPEGHSKYGINANQIRQIGLMLSLKLSDGSPNPPETFGKGEFGFSLFVESIETIPLPADRNGGEL